MSSRRTWTAKRAMRTTILTGFLASQIIPSAVAQPSGGNVVAGQGSIAQNGTHTQIDQGSGRLIIEWDSFDTSVQDTVRFVQPGRDAIALNRVLSGQATQFDGSLFANGNVIIVNGAGIHFGATSIVDVGGLIASTSDITNNNFLSDRFIFDQPGLSDAMVTNAGTITARDAGLAALVGPGVENSGLIRAELGTVILASGEAHTIDFRGDGLISFAITSPTTTAPQREDGSEAEALVSNTGTVEADGGSVVMTASQASRVLDTAINMTGVAQANSVGVRNGRIVLGGGGSGQVRVSGQVSARGETAGTRGGTVHVTGEEVAVEAATIDVSGVDGGGTALVGGSERGETLAASSDIGYVKTGDLLEILVGESAGAAGDGLMPLASHTTVDADAMIDASSSAGNGGDVIVWGTSSVDFQGRINTLGGDNGFVEVSTRGTGLIGGIAQTGYMLVDPEDVCVGDGDATLCSGAGLTNPTEILGSTIQGVLSGGGTFEINTTNPAGGGTGKVDFENLVISVNNTTNTTAGTLIIQAADTIDLGETQFNVDDDSNVGANYEFYAGSSLGTSGAPVTSADINLGGQNLVTGGGYVILDAADDVFITDPVITGGGSVTITARGGNDTALVEFGGGNDGYIDTTDESGGAGAVTINANDIEITTSAPEPIINADGAGGLVTFQPQTAGTEINLGTDTAGSLSLTDATIDRIAADVLRIGSADAGNITISDAISPAQTNTLSLITGGSILDENGADPDITVANLALQAATGIANDDILEIAVSTLAVSNTSDFVSISNTGALTIGTVDGVSGLTTGGAIDIVTASPLTFAANLSAGGNITATANDTGPADADNITVNAGITVQSTGGNVTLRAGDDVVLGAGATVSANGTLTMTAGFNDSDGDGGISFGAGTLVGSAVNLTAINDITLGALSAAGGMVDITSTAGAIIDGNDPADGTLNIIAQSLSLSASTGIGGAGVTATLETQVSNLEAQTDTGGIFLDNTGDLTIGGVSGTLNGVRVLTAGDIELTNAGRIDINVGGENVVGPADITVIANGASADILAGSNTVTPNATVQSTGGTVTLMAGRDLLLGDVAGAGTLGNVFGGGSVVLDAGRDITVDTGTFIQASGAGTITANAGRNISVLDTSGPFNGAEIRTQGGDITLTTGAGGVFTANNGASPAVQTTVSGGNGNITINADAMDIQNSILAGSGIVTLQTVTNGQLIDLGTETAGSLSLTDAELDFITAGTLRIGGATTGSIDLTAAISPANVTTLSLITGGAITDNNAVGADITVANLAMQAVNGIGSADAIDMGVGTVAAANSTSGSIKLFQLTGLGDLTVGTVDGVVGVSNQATLGLDQTQVRTENANLIINSAVFSAADPLLLAAGGTSLLDNNAAVSTGAGFGIDLQGASMALEGGTISAGNNGRVRISPVFVGQAIDLGSTSDAGAALELSNAELNTITAGTLQIGRSGIGDITITDEITLASVGTLDLETSSAVLDGNLGTDITVDNLVFRTGAGFGTAGDAIGLDVNNLAFSNSGGVVNLSNSGSLTIAALDGLTTSSNTGTTTTVAMLGSGALTFAVDTTSTGDATFTAPTLTVNNGITVDVTAGALAFNGTTVNLDGNLTAANSITGTATTVNVLGSTGGAEIQDGIAVAVNTGATVNVADGTYTESVLLNKANVSLVGGAGAIIAPASPAFTISADGTTVDGFTFAGTSGSPAILLTAGADNVTIANGIITGTTGTGDGIQVDNTVTAALTLDIINVTMSGVAQDGLSFDGALNGADISISDSSIMGGRHGINFSGAISGATTLIDIANNTLIEGANQGIVFTANVTDATVRIRGNGTNAANGIRGQFDAIAVNGNPGIATLTNATFIIGGDTAADGNFIVSSAQGLDIDAISGGRFVVANNDLIQGSTAIEFEQAITNNAEIVIANNGNISGGNGIAFLSNVSTNANITITDNVIGSIGSRVGNDGIAFRGGILDTATVVIGGTNQVFATQQAIQIDDLQSPSTVSITGGTYNGTGGALLVDNTGVAGTDGRLNIGTAAYVAGAGNTVIEVLTDAGNAGVDIDFTGMATIDGGATGLRLSGPGIDILNNTLGTIAFTNQTGDYITLANGAEFLPGSPTIIDAQSVSFEGTVGNAMTAAELFAAEDKITHFPDNNTLGLIDIAELFVLEGESIQTAVNAAGLLAGPQTVIVNSGTFGGSVEVWVDNLTLAGRGATTIIDTDAVDAFANNGDADNGFYIAAFSATSGVGDVTGVTIDGFSFDTVTTTGANIGIELGEAGVSTAINATVSNNSFTDLLDGIVATSIDGTTTISNATMSGIASNGIDFLTALDASDIILIENSSIASRDDAVRFSSTLTGTNVAITGSTIEGGADGLEFTGAIGGGSQVTIAGNQRIEGLNTFVDEDGLGDGIAFRGAISGVTTSILIDDNTLIRGADRGINFADGTTGGPATVTDASITISGNDEIRGTDIDGILFNADLTNATIVIGGPTAADGNGLIIGDDEGLDIENVIGGSFTIANNTRIEGSTGDGIEFEGQVSNADVTVQDNGTVQGVSNGIIFENSITDSMVTIANNMRIASTVDIAGRDSGIAFEGAIGGATTAITITDNTLIEGQDHGISFADLAAVTDASITIARNDEIRGVDQDGILFNTDLTNATIVIGGPVTADGNGLIIGDDDGIDFANINGGSFTIANNTSIIGSGENGIEFDDPVSNADVTVQDNGTIQGGDNGIVFEDSIDDSTVTIAGNTAIQGLGFDGILFDGDVINSAIAIAGKGDIVGGRNGINIGDVIGGSLAITGVDLIEGVNADGISTGFLFAGVDLDITGNVDINGGDDGITILGAIGPNTVTIDGNQQIRGDDNGISTLGTIGGSLAITNNMDIIGGANGIAMLGTIGGSIAITNNANINGGANGIAMLGAIAGSLEISGNTEIRGDTEDGILVALGLIGSDVSISTNESIIGGDDGMDIGAILGGSFTVNDNGTVQGAGDGLEFSGAISGGSQVIIAGNTRIEGLGTVADEDNLGDGIAFRGAISGTATSLLIDDNSLIRGSDRGINFASAGTGGPATVTDASITISRNDEVRGTDIDGILFNADLTNATIMIGGPVAADGNGLIIGGDDGIDIENVNDGSFTIANNTRIEGGTFNGIEFEGAVSNGAVVAVQNNATVLGDNNGVIFLDTIEDSTVAITGNIGIYGDGFDGVFFEEDVTGSTITVNGNGEIIGNNDGIVFDSDLIASTVSIAGNGNILGGEDGMNIDAIDGGSFMVSDNTLIRGTAGSGIEFEGPVSNVATFVVDTNTIIGGEEAIEFDTPATITDSTLAFRNNSLQAGTDGMLFDGLITDSMITTAQNIIVGANNGIAMNNLGGGVAFSVDASNVLGGQAGLTVTGSNAGGGQSTITLGQSTFEGQVGAGVSITTQAGGSGVTTDFQPGVTMTGSPSLAMSGPNQAIAGNTIENASFNSVGGGNFIVLANGALFEPGRPTIINGIGATFDGVTITTNAERPTIDWVESRIIDFDDNATLGQIFFFNLPYLFDYGVDGPVRVTNVQTPGDWILRPDFTFQILATNPLIGDYGLGTCLLETSETGGLPIPRCIAPTGDADPSPSIMRFMEGMEQLSALQ